MQFRATQRSAQLATALSTAISIIRAVDATTTSLSAQTAAGSVAARAIVIYMDTLSSYAGELDAIAAVPGLGAYAAQQANDATYDIAQAFATVRAAMDAVVTWIAGNVPTDGVRWISVEEIVGGRLVERMLTPQQTAGLRTQLDALAATIA